MEPTQVKSRGIARTVSALETMEGEGVRIRRAFPTHTLTDLDPFLLLDHLGPVDLAPGEAKGFPDHPHRGFETVTYVLEGAIEHRDSRGNHGILGPGDVQWMTAGSGLVHSEMPGSELIEKGGRLHGFQLWVNLPRRDKMIFPRYQEIPGAGIPIARSEDNSVEVKVVAGTALGRKGLIETRIPITYLHVILQPGASYAHPIPATANAFAYVFRGEAGFGAGPEVVAEGRLVTFLRDGDAVSIQNAAGARGPVEALLVAGEPLGEPVARAGPFVMNTREELLQAFEDYRNGRMGLLENPA